MADVTIKVSSVGDSTGVKGVAKDVDKLNDTLKETVPVTDRVGKSSKDTGEKVEHMGDKMDETKRDAQQLIGRLLILSETTKDLGRQFAATGKVEFLKEFQRQAAELNRTRRVAKVLDIEDPTVAKKMVDNAKKAATEGASTFASLFQGGVIETFKGMPSEAKAALAASAAAMGVALAVPMIATVNSVLLAGIGGGVLAAGVAIAANSMEVQNAFGRVGAKLSERLAESARPFRGELVQSADIFGDAFARNADRVDSIFAGLAQEVKPLAEGLAGAGENALPGLERAAKASQPLIHDLAKELPKIGSLIGEVFDALADAGPGLQLVFKFILVSVEALIKSFEFLVRAATPVINDIAQIGEKLGLWDLGGVETLAGVLPEVGDGASDAASSFSSLSREAYNTADAADRLNEEFADLFEQFMSIDEANLAVRQGFHDLNEELRDGARTLDTNTQAGRDNVEAVLAQIDVLNQQREAAIAAGNGTVESTRAANEAYRRQVEEIRKLLIQLGYPPAAIDEIIKKYQQLAEMPNITKYVRVLTSEQASSGRGGPGQSRGSGLATGGIVGAAVGGPRGGLLRIGQDVAERGWEYASLPMGSMVYSHANSTQMDAMGAQAARSGGRGGIRVELIVTGDSDGAIGTMLNRLNREGAFTVRATSIVDE